MQIDPLILGTAVEAVLRAGAMQRAAMGRHVAVRKKSAIDLVTEVDLAVERDFRALIAKRFEGHEVLGEEFGGADPAVAEPVAERDDATRVHAAPTVRWVFDPLDGTTNFAHGLPIFCASLGVEIDGELAVGAVYDPMRDELFTAERGGGAFLNGEPLNVTDTALVGESLLVTGFPYDLNETRAELVGLFDAFLARARGVRRLGSAALDLCYVAAGRFDGFWEQRLHPWDIAAGALIVREAGGRVTSWDPGQHRLTDGTLLATNAAVHDDMLRVIDGFRRRT